MKITVIAVGRMKAGPERSLCERYSERFHAIAKSLGVQDFRLIELGESNQRRSDDRMQDEARDIAGHIPDSATLILFDERGKTLTSPQFAEKIQSFRADGVQNLALVIGGPDGLHPSLRQRAGLILSFGAMTMPHQIVRALVFEQLYRAATILTGHPYHRV